jgi:flagellar basal body rod protein FlgB
MAAQGVDGVLAQALAVTDLRTRVLANDVANANTPGFQAQDATFAAVLRAQMGLGPGPDPLRGVVFASPGLMTPNGNGVDLEATMVALQQTVTASQGIGQTLADHFQTQQNVITTLEGA